MADCQQCGISLVGDEIPEASRHYYGDHTHFGLEIGVEVDGVYDGVLYWMCPSCGFAWPRFTDANWLGRESVSASARHNDYRIRRQSARTEKGE